jgi:hypothetical protein
MTISYFVLLVCALSGWLWFDALRVREMATGHAKDACRHYAVQFLDDTVALNQLSFKRDSSQRLCLHRVYQFEFCETNLSRKTGYVMLLSRRLESLQMETSGASDRVC